MMFACTSILYTPYRHQMTVTGRPTTSVERLSVPLNLFASEQSLKFKTCLTAQVGFEYILSAFEKTFDQYAQRFNREFDPLTSSLDQLSKSKQI